MTVVVVVVVFGYWPNRMSCVSLKANEEKREDYFCCSPMSGERRTSVRLPR